LGLVGQKFWVGKVGKKVQEGWVGQVGCCVKVWEGLAEGAGTFPHLL
jgi:hypothetical protein